MEPTGLQRLYSPVCISQGSVGSSNSQALVSLDFVVVVIDKYWVIHKPLVRVFGSISQRQLLAGRLSCVLEAEKISWEESCIVSAPTVSEMAL